MISNVIVVIQSSNGHRIITIQPQTLLHSVQIWIRIYSKETKDIEISYLFDTSSRWANNCLCIYLNSDRTISSQNLRTVKFPLRVKIILRTFAPSRSFPEVRTGLFISGNIFISLTINYVWKIIRFRVCCNTDGTRITLFSRATKKSINNVFETSWRN